LSVATFALYRITGTPAGLDPTARTMPTTMEQAVAELEATLRRNPNEPEGWRLLGQSYTAQERHAEAQEAFAQAVKLMPEDATLLVEAAQARLYANPERRLDEEATGLLRRALAVDPQHQRAAWFLGMAQRQAGQPAEAARTWQSLLPRVDAATARSLRVQIDGARSEAGLPPLPAQESASAAGSLTVKVSLDPDFASRVRLRGDASVFVIARIPGGPPMPVAVEKHTLQGLPLTLTLDDNDSLMPTRKLSELKEVELLARLSASGDATRQEGDLESAVVRVALPAAAPVELILGE
jgi:cytochrome c-type biogenesis protein CcmH